MIHSGCLICARWPGPSICEECVSTFLQKRPRCTTCATEISTPHSQRCGQCVQQSPPLSTCLAAVDYAYPWSGLIAQMKFSDETGLARSLGSLLSSTPGLPELLTRCDRVTPIPLSAQRLRERGYNQAHLLARALDRKITHHLLQRIRQGSPQSTSTLAQRATNVRHAFMVPPQSVIPLKGQRVLLVDDVMTTGATLFEAAHTLLRAGAAQVSAVVLARTPAHEQRTLRSHVPHRSGQP
jgi:ComF family protein